jgi:hypothetical protein
MFQPRPHGVIAVDPLKAMHIKVLGMSTLHAGKGLLSAQSFLSCFTSIAAS